MVAHETNSAHADALSRHQLRLHEMAQRDAALERASNGSKPARLDASSQRLSESGESDSEDDVPIAAHFSKFMKASSEKARAASPSIRAAAAPGTSAAPTSAPVAVADRIESSSSSKPHKHSEVTPQQPPSRQHSRDPHPHPHPPQQHQPQLKRPPPTSAPLSASSSPAPGPKDSLRRPKPDAPKFLLLLYEILDVEDSSVIRWSEDGLALQILDQTTVTDKVLPKYFNHTNFHSFQRQLNYFGFRKWTKSKTDICTFSHPYFRQNEPALLQLIKRKKAPRRPTVAEKADAQCASQQRDGSKTQVSGSPTTGSKRKLASDAELHRHCEAELTAAAQDASRIVNHLQQLPPHSTNAPASASLHGVAITPVSHQPQQLQQQQQHHHQQHQHVVAYLADATRQEHDHSGMAQYLPASALLNSVISPLAASECNKKAKKIDMKAYTEFHAPLQAPNDPTATSASAMMASASSFGQLTSTPSTYSSSASSVSHSLPTLDIVRNRIIRRQTVAHASGSNEQHLQQQQQQQLYANSYLGYSSPLGGPHNLVGTTGPAPAQHSPATGTFTNSFSDPVDILLRIKKSRTMSSSSDAQQLHTSDSVMLSPDAAALASSEQNENLATLQNFLISHTLYTNRLESQLKMAVEENETLKHLVETKQREVEVLQSERKILQGENAVLMDDKTKLFEINRELLAKLFPQ